MCFGSKSSSKKTTTMSGSSGDNNKEHEEMMASASKKSSKKSSSKTYDGKAPSRSLRPKSRSKSPVTSLISTGSLIK
jgi:hypothetical protein